MFSNTLDTWTQIFKEEGKPFERAKVVLYSDAVSTGCGDASSAVGPVLLPDATSACTSISASTTTWRASWAHRATSRGRT